MTDYLDKYGLVIGNGLVKILDSEDAKAFLEATYEYTSRTYFDIFLPAQSPKLQKAMSLNMAILRTALESAYVDIHLSEYLHELKDGASAERNGAAIASWLSRFKPIQFARDVVDTRIVWINPIFALQVGWSFTWQLKNPDLLGEELASSAFNDIIHENSLTNDIVYHMTWRNPGFKELTLLFQTIL